MRLMLSFVLVCAVVAFTGRDASADLIEGSDSADWLVGTGEDDIIWAYAGADYVDANAGSDEIHLGAGGDESYGGTGPDDTFGGASGTSYFTSDRMYGGDANDYFRDVESSDLDYVCGGPDNDTVDIYDGDGNDRARGQAGSDSVTRDGGDYWEQDGGNPCPP